jgi:transposase-like protein
MPMTCTVCRHADRVAIDRALVGVGGGGSLRSIAKQYGVSASAVLRHRVDHLPASLLTARDAEEATNADDLLAELRSIQARARGLLDRAEEGGDLRAAVAAIRELRGNLELLAKLTQQLDTRPTLNVLVAPEWLTLRAALLDALAAFPQARAAVAGRLAALEAE